MQAADPEQGGPSDGGGGRPRFVRCHGRSCYALDLISLVQLRRFHPVPPWRASLRRHNRQKKADVVEYPEEFDHVGLLVNRPPELAGLPFLSSSDDFDSNFVRAGCEPAPAPSQHHFPAQDRNGK